jgi:Protein of unknown function (DUF3632)
LKFYFRSKCEYDKTSPRLVFAKCLVCFILKLGQLLILENYIVVSDLPSPEDFSEWLNLNSFAAHLYSEDMTYGSMYAMYHLRAALEEENASREIANRNISLASE